MRLSIVIPARNSSTTIGRCLQSVAAQGMPDLEVIIVDDGSTDDLRAALRMFEGELRLTIVEQLHAGVSVARNQGIAAASGKLLMFMDADDYLVEGELEAFISDAESSGADIAVSDFLFDVDNVRSYCENINSELNTFGAEARGVFQTMCLARVGFGRVKNVGLLGAPWAKLYSRDFLLRLTNTAEWFAPGVARGQDVLFNVEAFGRARLVRYHRRPTYVYVISGASHSRRSSSNFALNVSVLVTAIRQLIRFNGWEKLSSAVDKLCVVLFDEAVMRKTEGSSRAAARVLSNQEPFVSAISGARFSDFSALGAMKLLFLKLRLYGFYSVALTFARRRAGR